MPTFYADFPTDVSPLTRQKPSEPRVAERWDLVAFGAGWGLPTRNSQIRSTSAIA